ncbi:MAG: hypothetical protein LBD23_02230 [Oscillospiraceae bacterium]|jgi:hypothetical protein|nr:hypothetical protein [Oscillospiraceae bacterium]
MKKAAISLILVIVMLVAFSVPAMASNGADIINDRLIELAITYSGNARAISVISDARSWLAVPANADTISASDANSIVGHIDTAVSAAGDAEFLGEMTSAQQNKIMASINSAAGVLGWTVNINTSSGVVSIRDADGNSVTSISLGNTIKQTGLDMALIIIVIAGITVLFGIAIIIAVMPDKKKRLNKA